MKKIAEILCFLGFFMLVSCDYATREELETEIDRVDSSVSEVQTSHIEATHDFGFAISAQQSRLEWVERRQGQAESVMEVMGDGFNVLTESIEETQEETRKVRARQYQLEKRVENKFKPVLTQAFEQTVAGENEVVVLAGFGTDLRTRQPLETLRLILDDPPILRRTIGAEQFIEFTPTEEIGDRIYGLSEDPDQSICLEIIRRKEDTAEFSAADCQNPFLVWEFRVQ